MLCPLGTCLIYSEDDWLSFFISTVVTLVTGVLMTFCIRPTNTSMAKREGFLLTALVWVVFSLFGMLPFIMRRSMGKLICRVLLKMAIAIG